jgi:hypothetical protein
MNVLVPLAPHSAISNVSKESRARTLLQHNSFNHSDHLLPTVSFNSKIDTLYIYNFDLRGPPGLDQILEVLSAGPSIHSIAMRYGFWHGMLRGHALHPSCIISTMEIFYYKKARELILEIGPTASKHRDILYVRPLTRYLKLLNERKLNIATSSTLAPILHAYNHDFASWEELEMATTFLVRITLNRRVDELQIS